MCKHCGAPSDICKGCLVCLRCNSQSDADLCKICLIEDKVINYIRGLFEEEADEEVKERLCDLEETLDDLAAERFNQ